MSKNPYEGTIPTVIDKGPRKLEGSEREIAVLKDFDGLKKSKYELAKYIAEKWKDEEKLMLNDEVLDLKGYSAYALDDELVDTPNFRERFNLYLSASGEDRNKLAEEIANLL